MHLLEKGMFKAVSPNEAPVSYVSGRQWRPLLESAAKRDDEQSWYALLQLGVHYYIFGEIDNARNAWEKSVKAKESAWGFRNLSLLYKNEYKDTEKAVEYIKKAVVLKSDCRGILIDCAKIFTDNGLNREWLSLYGTLNEKMQSDGRIRLFKAIAHINLGETEDACAIVNKDFVMCDIQEGEVSVSHIWQQLYSMKLKAETGLEGDELTRRTAEVYPLPRSLDFRMHE